MAKNIFPLYMATVAFISFIFRKYKQNCKADILHKKLTLRDTNTTETDKVGLQPWTVVATLLYRFQPCWCLAKSTFVCSISALQF